MDDDAALSISTFVESHDHHAMALQATPPPIVTVLGTDPAGGDEHRVTCCADVVVPRLGVWDFANAGETVISRREWLNRMVTYIACCGEGERFEVAEASNARQD